MQYSISMLTEVAKNDNRRYGPDPGKAGDLEKLSERALPQGFDGYHPPRGRRLRSFVSMPPALVSIGRRENRNVAQPSASLARSPEKAPPGSPQAADVV